MTRRTQRSKPVTTAPSRAAVYHRVSSEEQVEGYSLDAQQRATRAYCAAHGWTVVEEYRDEGKSRLDRRPRQAPRLRPDDRGRRGGPDRRGGRPQARPLLPQPDGHPGDARTAWKRAESGSSRSPSRWTSPPRSARSSWPTSPPSPSTTRDNLSAETKKGKAERKKQGLYNGHLPFGVAKGPNGVPILDEEPKWCDVATRTEIVPADGLRLLFDLAASGQPDRAIAQSRSTPPAIAPTATAAATPSPRTPCARSCRTGSTWANSRTGTAAGCPDATRR